MKKHQDMTDVQDLIPKLINLYSKSINLLAELEYFSKNNENLKDKKKLLVHQLYVNIDKILKYINAENPSLQLAIPSDSAQHLKLNFNEFVTIILTFYQT